MSDRYTYYYIEDGECSLDNPIVWKRLLLYVSRVIRFTPWIKVKGFIEPVDILLAVKNEIKHLKPFQYGDENTDAITFLIKKINTQTGREWWKYLKSEQPWEFERLRALQKANNKIRYSERHFRPEVKKKIDKANKKNQQNNRDALTDHYIIGCVYNNLKHQTGVKYTFDEIRKQFPYLIEQKRESILLRRQKKAS